VSRGVYIALSGAVAQEIALESTASNIANASSPGYQRLRPVFREVLAQASDADPSLRYASVERTALDASRGPLRTTGRGLDVALPAGAYLAVSTTRGERYTRAGSLVVDADGTLRAGSAPLVSDGGGPIKIAKGGAEPVVAKDGTVRQGDAVLGRLRVVRFAKPEELVAEGGSLLAAGQAGQPEPSKDEVEVGAVEESNVDAVTSMSELMTATRTFEAFQRAIDAFGEADRKLLTTVPGAFE
jgi:flagellar basal body rod protein FlgG